MKRQRSSTVHRLKIATVSYRQGIYDPDYYADLTFYDQKREIQRSSKCGIFLLCDSRGKPFAVYFPWIAPTVLSLSDILRVDITLRDRVAEKVIADAHQEEYLRSQWKRQQSLVSYPAGIQD